MARSAESRRLPCGVVWVMTRMRLYAYALFRVVARAARNWRGRSHGYKDTVNVRRVSSSRTGAVGPEMLSLSSWAYALLIAPARRSRR